MNLASVRVGGSTVASFLDFTHESATFLMPLSESSTEEDVTIVVAGQSSGISPFYYYNLTSISPEFGSAAGGTNVAITGEGFVQMPTGSPGQVYFGSTDAAKMDVSVDGNEIKFVTVSHGAAVGTFLTPHVGMDRVTFNALNSPGSNFFFYPRPIVEDFAPKSGPTSGGTAVSIRADFFMTGTYEVTFGDSASIACTLSSEDDRVLICVAPSLPGGEAKQVDLNLTIDTADATSKTYVQAGTFQYYVPPAVVSIDPPLGPISASNETVVVITGSNFVATSDRPRIKVGSVERETFFDNVNGTIRFKTTVPRSLVEQTLAIEVALNGQQFTSSGVGFLFYDFPEEIVLLHQTLNFTLDDFSSTMDNKTIFVKAIAAALNVLKSQVNIIRIEINHNVGSRRLHNVRDTAIDTKKLPQWTSDDRRSLQETNTTLSIEYSVETRKANAQNISRNMSKIGASVGSPETTVLVSSLAESFEIPSESLSVNIAVHVVSVPEVDVSIPRIGPVRGGTALLISGKDFLNSTLITCKFDGLRISTSLSESDKAKLRCGTVEAIGKDTETCTKGTFLSHTQISCVTPIAPLATGKVFISVSMNNQQFNADRTFDFTYYDPAIATSLSEDFMPLSASTMVVSGSFFDTSVVQIQYTLDAEATLCKSCVKTSASPAASGILCEACPLSKHRCGDLVCSDEAGETCNTCPEDCGVCTTAVCGDFLCADDETCSSCSQDCLPCDAATLNICGDGRCDVGEHCASCSQDCGNCTGAAGYNFACGDGICDADVESCLSCPKDCADGVCGGDETCASCPADCDNCWPGKDMFILNCTLLNTFSLECPLPSVSMRQILRAQINIDDVQHNNPVLWTANDAKMSITYYEPYNITEAIPSAVSWSGGLSYSVLGKNLDVLEGNPTGATCTMGSVSSTAFANLWYRTVYISNPGSEDLRNHQVLVEFDSQSPIATGALRADCEDLVLRAGKDGSHLPSDVYAWLDITTCNQTSTALWIKIPTLRAGASTSFRLVHGSLQKMNQANPLTSSPGDVFEKFESFDNMDTVKVAYPPYSHSKLIDGALEITGNRPVASTSSHGRFSEPVSRPYVFEAMGRVTRESSHLMYVALDKTSNPANASASYVWTIDKKSDILNAVNSTCTELLDKDKSRRRTRQNLPDYIRYHRHQACQCSHRHSCCMCSQCLGQQHQCTHCQQRTDWCCTRQCHHSILFRCKYHLHRQCLGALT